MNEINVEPRRGVTPGPGEGEGESPRAIEVYKPRGEYQVGGELHPRLIRTPRRIIAWVKFQSGAGEGCGPLSGHPLVFTKTRERERERGLALSRV